MLDVLACMAVHLHNGCVLYTQAGFVGRLIETESDVPVVSGCAYFVCASEDVYIDHFFWFDQATSTHPFSFVEPHFGWVCTVRSVHSLQPELRMNLVLLSCRLAVLFSTELLPLLN